MKTACLILIMILLAGCGAKQPLTRAEMEAKHQERMAMLERTYQGKTQQDVLDAADKIFRLADTDYTIEYKADGMVAKREWFIYLVLAAGSGTDTWTVQTTPVDDGTKIRVFCQSSGSSTTAHPTGGGGVAAISSAAPNNILESPRLYKLFYDRMDYLLGLPDEWVSCEQARKMGLETKTVGMQTVVTKSTDKEKQGIIDPLCVLAEDFPPSALAP